MSAGAVHNDTSICQGFLYQILNQQNEEVGHIAGTFYFQDQDYILSEAVWQAIEKSKIVYLKAVPKTSPLIQPNECAIDYKIVQFSELMDKCVAELLEPQKATQADAESWLNAILTKLPEQQTQDFYRYFPAIGNNPAPALVITYLQGLAYKYGVESLEKQLLFSRPDAQLTIQWVENATMAEKIHESLKNNEKPFIAVDISHLWGTQSGQEGLIELLKLRGWSIQRVGTEVSNDLFVEAVEHFEGFPGSEEYINQVLFWSERAISQATP